MFANSKNLIWVILILLSIVVIPIRVDAKHLIASNGACDGEECTQAAVFHVYDRYKLNRVPRRYVVEAGKTLSGSWNAQQDNLGMYDLWVLGPNGYHRHFKGNLGRLADSGVTPEIRVCYDIANGDVYADLMNTGKAACTFTITPLAYRTDGPWQVKLAGAGMDTQHWSLASSGQWYDFAVTCDSDPAFYRRFAGRVETGKHTVSDPAMGMSGNVPV